MVLPVKPTAPTQPSRNSPDLFPSLSDGAVTYMFTTLPVYNDEVVTYTDESMNTIVATALAGDLPNMTGYAKKYIRVDNAETAAEFFGGNETFKTALTNSGNDYSATVASPITSYRNGEAFLMVVNADNTGNATLNISGVGSMPWKRYGPSGSTFNFEVGELQTGQVHTVVSHGSEFISISNMKHRATDADGVTGTAKHLIMDPKSTKAAIDAHVSGAIAALAFGSVGTYCLAKDLTTSTHTRAAGTTVAGSNLKAASYNENNFTTNNSGPSLKAATTLSGTWRLMGYVDVDSASADRSMSLYLRIS